MSAAVPSFARRQLARCPAERNGEMFIGAEVFRRGKDYDAG